MEIAYVVKPRPDTGLWNAKIAIWLFIASEVMLFGGLFSAYVFLRMGAEAGRWPHGIMDVPVGTINTAILIFSSITAVFAWAALKMRQFSKYMLYMGVTIGCGLLFLCIKLGVEYPAKFRHFGAFIKTESLQKYDKYLGNDYLKTKGLEPRLEITGHLHEIKVNRADADQGLLDAAIKSHGIQILETEEEGKVQVLKLNTGGDFYVVKNALGAITNPDQKDPKKIVRKPQGVLIESYSLGLDPQFTAPTDPSNDRPHFIQRAATDTVITIPAEDVERASMFVPNHSTFLSIYFLVTILHALHVVGGLIVFIYFFLPFGSSMYKTNPEQFTNRVEVSCIYWHFVDLVWIFAFPVFYLL